jgi:hypothetical protein
MTDAILCWETRPEPTYSVIMPLSEALWIAGEMKELNPLPRRPLPHVIQPFHDEWARAKAGAELTAQRCDAQRHEMQLR